MNAKKIEFYKRLYEVTRTIAGLNEPIGKTTADITGAYNAQYNESKNTKEIAGGLKVLAKHNIVHKLKAGSVTYWRITGLNVYALIFSKRDFADRE